MGNEIELGFLVTRSVRKRITDYLLTNVIGY